MCKNKQYEKALQQFTVFYKKKIQYLPHVIQLFYNKPGWSCFVAK